MHAIFLTLLSTASAAELAPAHVIGNSVDFEHDGQVIVPPAFGQALANDLTPSNWILPEVQLVSWGVLVSDGHAVDGVVWAEIDDGGQSPFLVLVMDRTLDEGAVPIGPGSLLAEMAPTTSGLPNHTWSPELLDLALSEFQGFPNGPIDAEEEASVAYSTSSVSYTHLTLPTNREV